MTGDEIHTSILAAVSVSRADITAAKLHLAGLGPFVTVEEAAKAWASLAAPTGPVTVHASYLHLNAQLANLDDQVAAAAKWISAMLACCAAADELAKGSSGVFELQRGLWFPKLECKWPHGSASIPEFK